MISLALVLIADCKITHTSVTVPLMPPIDIDAITGKLIVLVTVISLIY
jgi:hypothetical protein